MADDLAQALDAAADLGVLSTSEDGLAERFVQRHGEGIVFDHDTARWFVWNGARWRQDDTDATLDSVRLLCREVAGWVTEPGQQRRLQSQRTIKSVEQIARSDQRVACTSSRFDADPLLLGTPGGTVDLRTGGMRGADPGDWITKQTAVAPGTEPPDRWLQFLDEATGRDDELVEFLQRMVGYCLTGDTREHALFFVYGDGGNGKSVFLDTINGMLGDYVRTAPLDAFTARKHEQHSTELARLQGARLVSAVETEEGRAWAESRIKQLTGGDKIAARFMRQDFFEFTPCFKLVIVGNHQPVLHNVDAAARRRFRIIPFTRKPPVVDKQLKERLTAEWPGILRWAIDGCQRWLRDGLGEPAAVTEATAAYFNDQDTIGAWLDERCIVGALETESTGKLFENWTAFAQSAGERPGTKKSFAQNLIKRGFPPERTRAMRGFRGLSVRFDPRASGIIHD